MLAKRRWLLSAAASLIILGLFLFIAQVREIEAAIKVRPEVGYLAPDFTLTSLDGKMVHLSDFRGKKGIFINFWATWGPPCPLEMPTLEKVYQEYQSRGLEILAISIDAGPKSAVKNFIKKFRLTFPVLLDPEMEVMALYRLFSIPASFLVDKQGMIRFKELGYRDWTNPESRKMLEETLR